MNEFDTTQMHKTSSDQQQERQEKQHQRLRQREDSFENDGKGLPLIYLPLPPRLQSGNGSKRITGSSAASFPRSLSSVLAPPFSHQSLWNDDFDPFMVALENVKSEKRGKLQEGRHGLRRTRSLTLSSFRGNNPKRPNGPSGLNYRCDKQEAQEPDGGKEPECSQSLLTCRGKNKKEPLKQASRSPKLIAEPTCFVLARLVRLNNDKLEFEANNTKETSKGETERGGSWIRKRKGHKIRKFLFENACIGKLVLSTISMIKKQQWGNRPS